MALELDSFDEATRLEVHPANVKPHPNPRQASFHSLCHTHSLFLSHTHTHTYIHTHNLLPPTTNPAPGGCAPWQQPMHAAHPSERPARRGRPPPTRALLLPVTPCRRQD